MERLYDADGISAEFSDGGVRVIPFQRRQLLFGTGPVKDGGGDATVRSLYSVIRHFQEEDVGESDSRRYQRIGCGQAIISVIIGNGLYTKNQKRRKEN